MEKKYEVTETMGIQEYTPEMQLRHVIQSNERVIERLKEQIDELKQAINLYHDELQEYHKLKNTLHPLIQRLWMLDSGNPDKIINSEREEIIETIAYRVSNEWISDEETYDELYERSFGK